MSLMYCIVLQCTRTHTYRTDTDDMSEMDVRVHVMFDYCYIMI